MSTKIRRHGLSIGMERSGGDIHLYLKATGKLGHEDYRLITPVIDSALEAVTEPRVRALFDATEFEGWELRAAWDDFRLGLKHGNKFDRVAIHGNRQWQELAARIGGWFTGGEVKYFDSEADALAWLEAGAD